MRHCLHDAIPIDVISPNAHGSVQHRFHCSSSGRNEILAVALNHATRGACVAHPHQR
jgi:hypothetical protein